MDHLMSDDAETRRIKEAERDVLKRAKGSDQAQDLVFEGHWHEAYPVAILTEQWLTDSARIHYLHLLRLMRGQSPQIIAMPPLDITARDLGHARATAVRDRLLLRLTGWISLRRRVRDARGRVRGQVYGIHSKPLSLNERLVHDVEYMALLSQCQTHADGQLRQAAASLLSEINGSFAAATRPREPVAAPESQGMNFEPSGDQTLSSNFELSEKALGSKFELSNDVVDFQEKHTRVQNLNSGVCSSSSKYKNTTTTTKGAVDNSRDAPKTHDPGLDALRWPENFTDNDYRLARIALRGVPPDRRQAVLDAYQHQIERGGRILDPVAYLSRLCQLACSGQLVPVRAQWQGPKAPAGKTPTDERSHDRRRLAGDIHALEQLLEAGPNPALEAQIAKLRQALAELEASRETPEPGDVT